MMGHHCSICKAADSRSDKMLLFLTIAVIRRYAVLHHNLAGPFLIAKATAYGGLASP